MTEDMHALGLSSVIRRAHTIRDASFIPYQTHGGAAKFVICRDVRKEHYTLRRGPAGAKSEVGIADMPLPSPL
jgi:hypothetical protein